MRALLIITLLSLTTAGCTVSQNTARSSGVGFGGYQTAPAAAEPAEGNYRQALFNDLQA